jgi:hypothetical protein
VVEGEMEDDTETEGNPIQLVFSREWKGRISDEPMEQVATEWNDNHNANLLVMFEDDDQYLKDSSDEIDTGYFEG